MLVPAVVACFLSTPYWEVSFVTGFNYNPYISISDTFKLMFGDSWQYFWPVIVISIFQIVGASLVMSAIDRHFRTGSLSFKSPWRLINYSVFALLVGVLILCVISIVGRFILFGLVILVQVIFSSAGASAATGLVVISIVAVAMFVVHVLIITPILYWSPVMFIYGYRFRDAAAASFKLTSGRKLFIGIFIPLVVCAGVQLIVGFLQAPIWAVRITSFVLFLFTNVYVTTYVILSFYQISGLDRRDVVSYEFSIPSAVTDAAVVKKVEPQTNTDESEEHKEIAHAKPDKKKNSGQKPVQSKKKQGAQPKQNNNSKKATAQTKRQTAKPKETSEPIEPQSAEGEGGSDVV